MAVLLILCVCVLVGGSYGQLAPFIAPCVLSDSACLKASAQKAVPFLAAGLPDLGISPLDPMKVDKVKANQAGLNLEFRDTVVKGLRNCEVETLTRQNQKMFLELRCSVTLVGDYTIGGRLLIMPIQGNGKYKIKIRDIVVKINWDSPEKVVSGEKYWDLTNWKHSTDVKTNVEFQFQNLFNGNKQLSDAVHQFANSNWKVIFQEVAPPIVKEIVTKIVNEVRKFFAKVPIKQLSLN